jgi:diguanylate cyclase (GGDEF)-like protein
MKKKDIARVLSDVFDYSSSKMIPIGLFGIFGFPLFYYFWGVLFPQPYENLPLRLVAMLCCFPSLAYYWLANRWKLYFSIYFYWCITFLLPFFFTFMTIKNGWTPLWVMSTLVGAHLLFMLVYNWIVITLILVIGVSLAFVAALMTGVASPLEGFHPSFLPLYGFVMITGMICVYDRIEDKKKLEQLANKDGLTGIKNRRCFMEMASVEMERQLRHRGQLSLILFDIDHFKKVNDRYGHAVGDQVLREVTCIALQCIRRIDLFGRIGGEEFAVLLPGTRFEEAMDVAERIRAKIAGTVFHCGSSIKLQVQVSLGIHLVDVEGQGLDAALKMADNALYRAKQSGRNKVCCSVEHWINDCDVELPG